ncbi:hypothetical protein ABEW61_24420 [Paenibacillus amylolyticus]|uniref:hypothetical protein n=1 Tax=Paenibacillus amylolyticus TaxID=1451 RepID=UPI0030FDF0B8
MFNRSYSESSESLNTVENSAVSSYVDIFMNDLKRNILSLYNPEFEIFKYDTYYSYVFHDANIIILENNSGNITNISITNYNDFIPIILFENFKELKNLPVRLERLKKLGHERFRNEIKDNLMYQRIQQNEKTCTALWLDYGIEFVIGDSLQLLQKE